MVRGRCQSHSGAACGLAAGLAGLAGGSTACGDGALRCCGAALGVVRKRLRAPLELRLCLASFRGMMDFVFKPSLRLARDVTVRTLDDAAEFARTYVGPRLPHRRDR